MSASLSRSRSAVPATRPSAGVPPPHGEAWAVCEQQREEIVRLLGQKVRLSKVCRLLQRRGVEVLFIRGLAPDAGSICAFNRLLRPSTLKLFRSRVSRGW